MNPFNTYFLQAAVEEMPIESTFFKSRYFPTDLELDVFGTSRVLADYREGGQKIAPFVLPRIGAIPATREGFSVWDLEPANIAISMPLTLDHLNKRGFGESILSKATPAERARKLIIADLAELNSRVTRAEELLAINTILDNGTTMRHRTDDKDIYEDVGVTFYDATGSNPAAYTPGSTWSHSTKSGETWTIGNWYSDMCAMVKALAKRGVRVTEFILAENVASWLLADGWFRDQLNNRRMEYGKLDPAVLTDMVYELGVFSFVGRDIRLLVHFGTYENAAGSDTAYVPGGTVIAIAPDVGRGLYGGVTLMDPATREFYTVVGRRAAEAIATQRPPARETCLYSRPLCVPKRKAPWMVAKNVLG